MNRSNPPWNVSRLARILSRERPAHTYSSYQTFLQKNMVERLNLQQKWRESRAEHGLELNQEHVPRNQRVKSHHAVHTTSSRPDRSNNSPPRVAGGMSVGELHAAFAPRSSSVESLDELDEPQNQIVNEQQVSHSSESESEEDSMDEEEMLAFENRHIHHHTPRPPPTKRRHESFLPEELDHLVDQLVNLLSELRWGQIQLSDGHWEVDIEADLPTLKASFWKQLESSFPRHSARSWMLHFERNASTLWSTATDRYVLRILPSPPGALETQNRSRSVSFEEQIHSHHKQANRLESSSLPDASASQSSDTMQDGSDAGTQEASGATSQYESESSFHDRNGSSPNSDPKHMSITLTNAEKTNSKAPQSLRRVRNTARPSDHGTNQPSESNQVPTLSRKRAKNPIQRADADSNAYSDPQSSHTVHRSETQAVPSTSTPKRASRRPRSIQNTPDSSMDAANVSNALPIQTPESHTSTYTPYSVRVGQRKDHHQAKAHARERQEASLSEIVPSPLRGTEPRSTSRSTSRSVSRSVPASNLHSVDDNQGLSWSTDMIDLSGALRPWQSEARRTSQFKIEQQLARAQYEARVWELCSDFALTTPAQLVPFMIQAEGDVDVCRKRLEEYIDALAWEYDTERTTILELLETQLGNFQQVIQVLDIQQRSFERSIERERSTLQRSRSRQ